MAFIAPTRNTVGIRWQGLRLATDLATVEMDDEASAKYYDSWRYGTSDPWGPFDTKADPAEDKTQFDLLCAMIQHMHTVMFHKINHRMNQENPNDPNVIPQEDYRYAYIYGPGPDPEIIDTIDLVAQARYDMDITTTELGVDTKQMVDHYRMRVRDLTGHAFSDFSVP